MAATRRRPARAHADPGALEHWSIAAGGADVAHLDIPAHASRPREFEIYCSFVVMHRDAGPAWHAMRVLVDGAQEWSRKVPTDDGANDTLELRFRRSVAVGRPLRITAIGEAEGAARIGLSISADEESA